MANLRAAERRNADALASLAGELGYPSTADALRERLAGLGDDFVTVAEVDGEVAGWIHVSLVRTLESDPFAEIRGLVVTERLRGRGLGTQLIAAAEEWTREQGIARLRLRTNVNREEAHRFYERRGFERIKTSHVYEIRVRR